MPFGQAPGQGFNNPGIIRAFQVIISSAGGRITGLFIYNGAPGLGNPPVLAAVPPGQTQDPYGNPASAVLNIGSLAGAHTGFDASGIEYLSDSAGNIRVVIDPTRQLMAFYATPGLFNGGKLLATISPTDGQDAGGSFVWNGFTTYTGTAITDIFASLRNAGIVFGINQNGPGGTGGIFFEPPVTVRIKNRVIATDPGTGNTDESWHSLAAGNNWVGTVFYRLTVENEVQIYADLTSPAAAVNGVTIVTLPLLYRPFNITTKWNATHTAAANFEEQFNLSTAGLLQSTGVGPSANVVINQRVPLDVP